MDQSHPAGSSDAPTQHLEAGAKRLGEAIARGFVSGVKEARGKLLRNLDSYKGTLAPVAEGCCMKAGLRMV
jgi:hypothetical protein